MSVIRSAAPRWRDAQLRRGTCAILATLVVALWVAALVARPVPDFSVLRVIAVVVDQAQQPVWTIRLAPRAHQIATDARQPRTVPAGRVYQLWLSVAGEATPRPLGLLPQQGRKVIPVTPEDARLLAGKGELLVSLEREGGSRRPEPTGTTEFRGKLNGS